MQNNELQILYDKSNTISKRYEIDSQLSSQLTSLSSGLHLKNFSPQCTKLKNVADIGITLTGIKKVLISLGVDAYQLEDTVSQYNKLKPFSYIQEDLNDKKTSYIRYNYVDPLITKIINDIGYDEELKNKAMYMISQGYRSKIEYVYNLANKHIKSPQEVIFNKSIDVLYKYNIHDGLFYGYQQNEIRNELRYLLKENLSFGNFMKKLEIEHTWLNKQPFYIDNGKHWSVCKINL